MWVLLMLRSNLHGNIRIPITTTNADTNALPHAECSFFTFLDFDAVAAAAPPTASCEGAGRGRGRGAAAPRGGGRGGGGGRSGGRGMPPGGRGFWGPMLPGIMDEEDEYEQAFAGVFGGFPASVSTVHFCDPCLLLSVVLCMLHVLL